MSKKYQLKFSRASGSTSDKINRALRNGWKPGAGAVSAFARKSHRKETM